ncbi:hypothetical protein GGF32_006789 [Allomyces javanicus]|nr:hypothetical protein GGF32_006789 [Allomyces javanicus]
MGVLHGLRELTLNLRYSREVRGLDTFYEQLSPCLAVLKILSERDWKYRVDDISRSVASLAKALTRLHHLQVFERNFVQVGDVARILNALSTRAKKLHTVSSQLRSLTLGLLVLDSTVRLHKRSRFQFGVDALTFHIAGYDFTWGDKDLCPEDFVPLEHLCLDSMRSQGDGFTYTDSIFERALTLEMLHVPTTLKSMTLMRCLPLRSVFKAIVLSRWTPRLPALTRPDLSHNYLMTSDLVVLQSQSFWPNLQDLNLSRNKIHTLVEQFPPKLRWLNVSFNDAFMDDLFPEKWIEALPFTLVRSGVFIVGVSDDAFTEKWIVALPHSLRELNVQICSPDVA